MADSSDHEDPFGSPSDRNARKAPQQPEQPKTPTHNSRYSAEEAQEARDAALRRELEGVRNINQVIEGVIGTLERAKGNMGVCASPSHRLPNSRLMLSRLCQRLLTMHLLCSTRGPGFCRKQSTTRGSFSIRTGMAQPRISLTLRTRPKRSSERPKGEQQSWSADGKRPAERLRMRRGRS